MLHEKAYILPLGVCSLHRYTNWVNNTKCKNLHNFTRLALL
ncbi:hypothetical protein HMPREF3190_01283 [Umbribacter vaginalis]|nr:hypothetical protein HMPREF3190_01283 [Coriobacteriales bacterium DNF00809]